VAKRYVSNTDEIEEIITESFLKINNHIATVTNFETFTPWIKKITVNTAINIFRSRKKYRDNVKMNSSFSYDLVDQSILAENEFDKDMDTDYLLLMINALPDTTKEVFNLFAIDGYTHKEIGELLNIKEELSRWHLYSARKQLCEQIKKYNQQFITT
jgi:RNA polymerase sigma-70 factor (ECF subfamily)